MPFTVTVLPLATFLSPKLAGPPLKLTVSPASTPLLASAPKADVLPSYTLSWEVRSTVIASGVMSALVTVLVLKV